MKILQVIPYFFVDWAGGKGGSPVETVYGLSKALTKRGHQITVYTKDAFNKGRKSKYQTEILDIDGIRVNAVFRDLNPNLPERFVRISDTAYQPIRG